MAFRVGQFPERTGHAFDPHFSGDQRRTINLAFRDHP